MIVHFDELQQPAFATHRLIEVRSWVRVWKNNSVFIKTEFYRTPRVVLGQVYGGLTGVEVSNTLILYCDGESRPSVLPEAVCAHFKHLCRSV